MAACGNPALTKTAEGKMCHCRSFPKAYAKHTQEEEAPKDLAWDGS